MKKTNTEQHNWSISLQTTSLLATGLGLGLAGTAHGAIVYTDINPDHEIMEGDFFIDMDNNAVDDFNIRKLAGPYGGYSEIAVVGTSASNTSAGAAARNYALPLASGDGINAGSGTFRQDNLLLFSYGSVDGLWENTTAFVGVQFDISGNNHFGWIQIQIDDVVANQVTGRVLDYAYEDQAGVAINAGDQGSSGGGGGGNPAAVPLPGALGMLAMGAVPLMASRRRRRKASASQHV